MSGGLVTELDRLRKELASLEAKSAKLAAARASLPPGSTRARVTTANARWARAAEARETIRRHIAELEAAQ